MKQWMGVGVAATWIVLAGAAGAATPDSLKGRERGPAAPADSHATAAPARLSSIRDSLKTPAHARKPAEKRVTRTRGKDLPKIAGPKVAAVTLETSHRVFAAFSQRDSVRLRQDFRVGDTDYTVRVTDFVPDFAMALESGRVFSRSAEPNNPAFRIIVRQKGTPQDTVWAFLNMPPHFARKSLLAFKVLRIDFVDRAPMANADTSVARGRP